MYTNIYNILYGRKDGGNLNDEEKLKAILHYCLKNTWRDSFSPEQLKKIDKIKQKRVIK